MKTLNFIFCTIQRQKAYELVDGFRLQLYDDLSVINANKTFKKLKKELSDSLYLEFEAPFYKIRYGNFKTKQEAELAKGTSCK